MPLDLFIDAHAVLMPGDGSDGRLLQPRRNIQVRVVYVNVPAEDAPNLGKDPRPVDQLQKRLVLGEDVGKGKQLLAPEAGRPFAGIDAVHGCAEPIEHDTVERVRDYEITLFLNALAFLAGQAEGQ